MRYVLVSLILITMVGCNRPQDIVLGPEPLKQLAEQGDKFKSMPEEDRMLLASYLTLSEMGKAFGADVKPTAGRTVGEVLVDAKAWKEKVKLAEIETKKTEAAADALKAKVLAERKVIADKISKSAVVAVIAKNVLPKNYEAGRFNELLVLTFAIENKSDKTIKQLKGFVTFKDATGDTVGIVWIDIDQSIKPGQTLKTDTGSGWKLNPFENGDNEKIAGREFDSMTSSFEPDSIAYEGGEVLKAPD